MVNSSGVLGTVTSSRRYKEDIQPMADSSSRLFDLRPVTFRYKKPEADGGKPIQFGLIAEEVAEAFPELVVLNSEGEPETVAYHLLPGLLLNELQKEHRKALEQAEKIEAMAKELAELKARIPAATQKTELETLREEVAELKRLTAQLAAHH